MNYCINCGAELEESAKFCQSCGHPVRANPETSATTITEESTVGHADVPTVESSVIPETEQKSGIKAKVNNILKKVLPLLKKYYKIIIVVVVVLVAILVGVAIYENTHCSYGSCNNASVDGSSYCYTHKCNLCSSSKKYNSNYCYYHDMLQNKTESSGSNAGNVNKDLKFSNIKIEHNSLYTVVTGTVTNNGSSTYKFVTVKGSFKDSSGKVIDTDSTYAVGSEGLAKGESKTFRMSVDKNYNIKKCDITIISSK